VDAVAEISAGEAGNIELVYTPLFSDYDALCNMLAKPWQAKLQEFVVWSLVVTNVAVGVGVLLTSDFDRLREYVPWNFLIAVAVLLLRYPVTRRFRQWNFRRFEVGVWEICISLSETQINSRNKMISATFDWNSIKRASLTNTHAFLWLNPIQALMLPYYALKIDEKRDEMLELIRRNVTQIENR
jgi:hypothetical protein